MGMYAGSMRTGASSRAETIQINGQWGVAGVPNTEELALLLFRTYATIAYMCTGLCRMPYEIRCTLVCILSNMPTHQSKIMFYDDHCTCY